MRIFIALVLALALVAARSSSAMACDPDQEWCDHLWSEPAWWEPPAYEGPSYTWSTWSPPVYEPPSYEPAPAYSAPAPVYSEPTPVYYEPPQVYEPAPISAPVYEPPVTYAWTPEPPPPPAPVWHDPAPWVAPWSDVIEASVPPAPIPAPVEVVRPPSAAELLTVYGLHEVTEVHAGNVASTVGLVTTYSTNTVELQAGTAARLVTSVVTGETSAYDALLSTGRMTLADGRPVKGDVYASYVWNGWDWVLDRYVFFQDDLEVGRLTVPPPTSAPPPPPPAVAPPAAPIIPTATGTSPIPVPAGSLPVAPAFVAPVAEDPVPASVGASAPASGAWPARIVSAGIALAPQADVLERIEVLRGRRVALWVRATVDGVPARVVAWELLSGEVTVLGPLSGTGDEPLVATWRSIPSGGAPSVVHLRATVDAGRDGARLADATALVIVRSPALVDP